MPSVHSEEVRASGKGAMVGEEDANITTATMAIEVPINETERFVVRPFMTTVCTLATEWGGEQQSIIRRRAEESLLLPGLVRAAVAHAAEGRAARIGCHRKTVYKVHAEWTKFTRNCKTVP